jgi:ribosomal protein S18 acetylase RimI-like enzyme
MGPDGQAALPTNGHRTRPRPIRATADGLTGEKTLGSTFGGKRLRVAPWQGNRYVALVGPVRHGQRPRVSDIERCLLHLRGRGVDEAVTPAMSAMEAEPFHQAGFEHYERLHLLACSLPRGPEQGDLFVDRRVKLTSARPWQTETVLDVDARAFRGFWRFDRRALKEARTATSSRRFQVARLNGRIVGYAITGRSGSRGYLQRLAVDPAVQGRGIGSLLVDDGFRWLHRHGVTSCMVNTQETNQRALALYERLGFRRQPQGLVVLRWNRDP